MAIITIIIMVISGQNQPRRRHAYLNLVFSALMRGAATSHGVGAVKGFVYLTALLRLVLGVRSELLGEALPAVECVLPSLLATRCPLLYLAQQRHDALLQRCATWAHNKNVTISNCPLYTISCYPQQLTIDE